MLSNTHPGALQESGRESLRYSVLVAVNPICGIKHRLFCSHFAFILILHNEAIHQEDIAYLNVTLAFCTDSWGATFADPHTVFLCNQNAVNVEKRGVKLNDLY
ncbi:hypothetical protein [Leclercia sp.]|uniref:hypothetical protein n=1 Tax=Leclercia sp. TaxID=1898428 RepID=UPI0028A60A28|nr:hypothetical protein [Leclercia sp.]